MSQREISPSSSSPVSDTGVARPDPASEHTSKTWTWAGRSGDLGGKHSTWTDFEHATRVFHGVETVCGERCKVGQLEERRGAELRFGEFKRKYDKGQAPVMIRGPRSTSKFELDKPRRELGEVREAPRSMGESEVELGETRRGDTRRMRESEQRQRRASGESSAPSAEEEEGDDVLEGTALLRIPYGAPRCSARATRCPVLRDRLVLSSYAPATRCPVLRYRMVLFGHVPARRCPVLRFRMVASGAAGVRLARDGSHLPYGATRVLRDVRY
eukprot:285457-Rhodomonas_salina.2